MAFTASEPDTLGPASKLAHGLHALNRRGYIDGRGIIVTMMTAA
jgi:hypothetical protein